MNPDNLALENLVTLNLSPSVQYALFDENNILYEFRKGLANLKENIPIQESTVFPVYSITKTLTALAILQLIEKGLFTSDTPASKLLPDIPLSETILVKHLLTHTAGLSNPFPLNWIHTTQEHLNFNRNEFFKPIIKKSIRKSKPGIKFRYSNIGYILLGQIIEAVTGNTYETYVSKNILGNLNRYNSVLTFVPDNLPLATGYHKSSGVSMLLLRLLMDTGKFMDVKYKNWKSFKPIYINGTSYGGLFANREGMIVYGQEILKDRNSIISSGSRQLLFTENYTNNGKPTGMCLAWFKGSHLGKTCFSHAGGGGGFYCELRIYPELKRGSFIILNRSGFADEKLLSKIDK